MQSEGVITMYLCQAKHKRVKCKHATKMVVTIESQEDLDMLRDEFKNNIRSVIRWLINSNDTNSNDTFLYLTSLNTQYEDLKHFFEGYREMMIIHLVGEQTLEDMGINTARYSPDSTRKISYNSGRTAALNDISLLEAYKKS